MLSVGVLPLFFLTQQGSDVRSRSRVLTEQKTATGIRTHLNPEPQTLHKIRLHPLKNDADPRQKRREHKVESPTLPTSRTEDQDNPPVVPWERLLNPVHC
ncbi:uncharacterized protein V6R79_005097 [Siganus canaliculatus]